MPRHNDAGAFFLGVGILFILASLDSVMNWLEEQPVVPRPQCRC